MKITPLFIIILSFSYPECHASQNDIQAEQISNKMRLLRTELNSICQQLKGKLPFGGTCGDMASISEELSDKVKRRDEIRNNLIELQKKRGDYWLEQLGLYLVDAHDVSKRLENREQYKQNQNIIFSLIPFYRSSFFLTPLDADIVSIDTIQRFMKGHLNAEKLSEFDSFEEFQTKIAEYQVD